MSEIDAAVMREQKAQTCIDAVERNLDRWQTWFPHPGSGVEVPRDQLLALIHFAKLGMSTPPVAELPIVERTECRPYDGVEHSLVQDAADDALTLASFPNAGAATKFVHSGNEIIRVRVSIHENRKPEAH